MRHIKTLATCWAAAGAAQEDLRVWPAASVVRMLVGSDQAELVSSTIFGAVDLGRPGGGFLYLTPLASAATYVPAEIRDRISEHRR